jgi:heptosyltransferase-2
MKILFLQTAFLGDLVFSTALLHAVARIYPQAEITLLASPRGGGVMAGDRLVKATIIYDKRGREKGLRPLLRLIAKVRGGKYDLVVSPHRSFRSALVARFSGAPVRLGFRSGWGGWAYNRGVPFPAGEKRAYLRELKLAASLGGEVPTLRPLLFPDARSLEEARRLLARAGAGEGATLVGLVIGTVWATKKWPTGRFLELGRRLGRRTDLSLVVLGGPGEAAEAAAFRGDDGFVNLVGQTTLPQLVAILSLCRVVVGGDTGPLHAATALGVPVVALFGPTDEEQFDFLSPSACLTVDLPCRPCRPHGSRSCPIDDWRCLPEISAAGVAEAIRRIVEI